MIAAPFATDFTDNAAPARPVLKGQFAPKGAKESPFATATAPVDYNTVATSAYNATGPLTGMWAIMHKP